MTWLWYTPTIGGEVVKLTSGRSDGHDFGAHSSQFRATGRHEQVARRRTGVRSQTSDHWRQNPGTCC